MKNISSQGFGESYTVLAHIEAHGEAHSQRTVGAQSAHSDAAPDDKEGRFSAKELAKALGISSATLRTRWYPWLREAVAESRLKVSGKFTELAKVLFQSYANDVVARELPPNEHGDAARAWAERKSGEFAPVASAEVVVDEPKVSSITATPSASGKLIRAQNAALEAQSDRLDRRAELLSFLELAEQADLVAANEAAEQGRELSDEDEELQKKIEKIEYRRSRRAHYQELAAIDAEERERILGKPQIGENAG
jgi:hypothetical protein